MTRRMKASHPDYDQINQLNNDLAILKNPTVWWNQDDLEFWQKYELENKITNLLDQKLDGGLIRDYITDLELQE